MEKKPVLVKKLDAEFSTFIRRRDSDEHGWGHCITCRAATYWKGADCGHYIERGCEEVRWDEQNCHLQCTSCNRAGDGMKEVHRERIVELYGEEVAERLDDAERRRFNIGLKVMGYQLEEKIKYYKRLNRAN